MSRAAYDVVKELAERGPQAIEVITPEPGSVQCVKLPQSGGGSSGSVSSTSLFLRYAAMLVMK